MNNIFYDIEDDCYRTYPDGDKATDIWDSFKKASLVTFQHILSKYKEIIGNNSDVTR